MENIFGFSFDLFAHAKEPQIEFIAGDNRARVLILEPVDEVRGTKVQRIYLRSKFERETEKRDGFIVS
jgi:hypothetical protein